MYREVLLYSLAASALPHCTLLFTSHESSTADPTPYHIATLPLLFYQSNLLSWFFKCGIFARRIMDFQFLMLVAAASCFLDQ